MHKQEEDLHLCPRRQHLLLHTPKLPQQVLHCHIYKLSGEQFVHQHFELPAEKIGCCCHSLMQPWKEDHCTESTKKKNELQNENESKLKEDCLWLWCTNWPNTSNIPETHIDEDGMGFSEKLLILAQGTTLSLYLQKYKTCTSQLFGIYDNCKFGSFPHHISKTINRLHFDCSIRCHKTSIEDTSHG